MNKILIEEIHRQLASVKTQEEALCTVGYCKRMIEEDMHREHIEAKKGIKLEDGIIYATDSEGDWHQVGMLQEVSTELDAGGTVKLAQPIAIIEKFKNTSIEYIQDFPQRLQYALMGAGGMSTIQDILNRKDPISLIRGVGVQSEKLVDDVLKEYGLSLQSTTYKC